MKIKMLEYYQDARIVLKKDGEYNLDDSKLLDFLLSHGKAFEVADARHLDVEPQFEEAEEPPHYGAKAEPELRHDDDTYTTVKKPPKRGRGAK